MAKEKKVKRRTRAASQGTKFLEAFHHYKESYHVWCQGLMFFKEGMTMEKLDAVIKEKLFKMPRFRSTYDFKKQKFIELELDEIDMSYHLVEFPEQITLQEVATLHMGDMHSVKKVDYNRPLWFASFFPNMEDGKSLVLVNISHCVGDGISLVEVVCSIMDEPEGGAEEAKKEADKLMIRKKRKVKTPYGPLTRFKIFMGGVWAASNGLMDPPDSSSPLFDRKNKFASAKRSVTFSDEIDLERVKELKDKVENATINDILVAMLNLTIMAYLKEHGLTEKQLAKKRIRASFPVNARRKGEGPYRDGSPHNSFGIGMFPFVTKSKDSVDLLLQVKHKIDRLKLSPYPFVQIKMASMLAKLMTWKGYGKFLLDFAVKTTGQLSNIPGPQSQVKVAGVDVEMLQFGAYNVMGLYLGLLTYNGKVSCTICLDEKFGDSAELAKHWKPQFEQLYDQAMKIEGTIKKPRGTFAFLNRL